MNSEAKYQELKGKLYNFLTSRRKKFAFVDKTDGTFKDYGKLILNSIAGCFHIPLLFYICYFTSGLQEDLKVDPVSLLSTLFFAISLGIFVDLLLGFILDKLVKNSNSTLKNILSVFGIIGFGVTAIFYFNTTSDKVAATTQFRATYIILSVTYLLSNANHVKNSFNYVPSQEDRKKLFYLEHLIQTIFLAGLVIAPSIVKVISGACDCAAACKTPDSKDCIACYEKCDDEDYAIVQKVCMVFTILTGVSNILQVFTVTARTDDVKEEIQSTFNSRLLEILENHYLFKTLLTSFVEQFVFFTSAIWLSSVLFVDFSATGVCLKNAATDGKNLYYCSRSFTLQEGAVIIVIIALVFFLLARNVVAYVLWKLAPLLVLGTAIWGVWAQYFGPWQAFFTLLFIWIQHTGSVHTKLYLSDAVFYDEYLSGESLPFLPISIHLLLTKSAFFLSIAFVFSLLGDSHYLRGFAIMLIASSAILFFLRNIAIRHKVNAFDKIHLAIERNHLEENDDVSFYDPITSDVITRPLKAEEPHQRKLIMLLKNLKKSDILLALQGNFEKVESTALVWMIVFGALIFADTVILLFYADAFATIWSWFNFIGLALLPLFLTALIYQHNVWAVASKLSSSKFKQFERSFLLRVQHTLTNNDNQE